MYFLQFVSRMNPQQTLQELLSENGVFWLDLLQKYFNDDLVTVIGSPSIQLQAKLVKFYYYKYFIDSHYNEKYNLYMIKVIYVQTNFIHFVSSRLILKIRIVFIILEFDYQHTKINPKHYSSFFIHSSIYSYNICVFITCYYISLNI